jgi:hypothetical protein
MPKFKDIQANLQQARRDREEGRKIVFRSREKLKKLQREKRQVIRSAGKDSHPYKELLKRENKLKKIIASNESRLTNAVAVEARLFESFISVTDPRQQLDRFSDDYPLLLFPVRLETRFKIIQRPNADPRYQLWVRIFPDECSIDTFDDTLSEAELRKARNYWINLWKAGTAGNEDLEPFIRDRRKGAWRELMGIFDAGRAYWIEKNYQPTNAGDIPVRNSETDRILVIATEKLPDTTVQNAIKDYWKAVFHANGDAEQTSIAFTAFVAALGGDEENAGRLIETYKPENIGTKRDEAVPAPDVKVAFLVFRKSQDMDTKLTSWSQAARVTTFPERFVLMGYRDGKQVINELGRPVPDPLVLGPDPGEDINQVLKEIYRDTFDTLTDDEKAEKYIEYLAGKSETKWLFDFEEVIKIGMGFKVDLSQTDYEKGFSRLFVLGVKLSANEEEGKSLLELLLKNHQFGDSGFSILPQGIPTNNTEDSKSGYSETEDADEAYERFFSGESPEDPTEETEKRDGRWLAELLGIDSEKAALKLSAGYYNKDQCEARAMNTALWNATIGYFMESMLTPVFTDQQRERTRRFFIDNVSGRGPVPAIRIGAQPYGILPVTTVSRMKWLFQDDQPVLRDIYSALLKVKEDWEDLLDTVAYVGKEGDAHKILLKTLGLHANSVEFDQRYAESFQHLFNLFKTIGVSDEILGGLTTSEYKKRGMDLLKKLGYDHDKNADQKIPLLEKFFLTRENDVNKPLIDDRKLSETDIIRPYTITGENYIQWLIKNAKAGHQKIKEQKDFSDNKIPHALLYDMLRHSLNLEFNNTGINLYLNAELLTEVEAAALRVDMDFIGIQEQKSQPESKWDLIYREDNRIADSGVLLVDYISKQLKTKTVNTLNRHLHEVIAALEHLQDTPTARLERVFVEHLDSCSYRLDAWLLGFVNLQLRTMRFDGKSNKKSPKRGIYLGAYGWLENLKPKDLKPENETQVPATLSAEQKTIFDPTGQKPPMIDDNNAGYVHAPSINHGLTAAVLRNAYISNASKEEAESYKVNLSSERVRIALSMIEGIQQGQSLGALLGYQLERGLHDRTDENLDIYIYELRKLFSLGSNRMKLTEIKLGKTPTSLLEADRVKEEKRFREEEKEFEEDKAITKIEARNVVDGLALLDHIKKTKIESYPFGIPTGKGAGKLKPVDTTRQQDAIDAEVRRLMNIRDAVADLAMAESVHQVVQGNYDRAAGALDAFSKGGFPQCPDVVQSPGSGVSLTHRFGIHLPYVAVPTDDDTPRAKAEPAVNKWLEDLFPTNLKDIVCIVEYKLPDYEGTGPNAIEQKPVSMANLGLMPIDLLYMLNVESDKSLTVLDDHILRFLYADDNLRPDVELEIKYAHTPIPGRNDENKITFFEIAPLIDSLRTLIIGSRPLLPTDIVLQNEAAEEQNASGLIDQDRISKLSSISSLKEALDNSNQKLKDDFLDSILPFIGSDLQLISVSDGSDIPDEGRGLLIVANLGTANTLHFRFFNSTGTKVVDKSENEFPGKSNEIQNLKAELAGIWDQGKVKPDQEWPIIDAVRFITGFTPLIDQIDTLTELFINCLHQLSLFGIQQAGFGFVYDRKRAIYSAVYKKVVEYKKRWLEKQVNFETLINDQLPLATTDEEKYLILQKAERIISTQYTIPLPSPDDYLKILVGTDVADGKMDDFKAKLKEMEDFLDSKFLTFKALIDAVTSLKSNLDDFDLIKLETEDEDRKIVVFAEDLKNQAEKLHDIVFEKSEKAQDLLNKHGASAVPKEKVKLLTEAARAIFGEDFQIIPGFTLSEEQGNELQKSFDHQDQLLDYQNNVQKNDFPVDEWLYGVARVREKMGAWENLVMIAEGLKDRSPLDLIPLQLPYLENDHWLGLAFPEDFEIESEKLLYTAYLPAFDATQPQFGLLVDEWTEVIPAKKETTGLTFHFDRPNSEPPQTMLLVTPPAFTGQWEWDDIVNTLNETLDLAKLRAVEPDHIDTTVYAQFLPATVAAVTKFPVTMALNYALKSNQVFSIKSGEDEE